MLKINIAPCFLYEWFFFVKKIVRDSNKAAFVQNGIKNIIRCTPRCNFLGLCQTGLKTKVYFDKPRGLKSFKLRHRKIDFTHSIYSVLQLIFYCSKSRIFFWFFSIDAAKNSILHEAK